MEPGVAQRGDPLGPQGRARLQSDPARHLPNGTKSATAANRTKVVATPEMRSVLFGSAHALAGGRDFCFGLGLGVGTGTAGIISRVFCVRVFFLCKDLVLYEA